MKKHELRETQFLLMLGASLPAAGATLALFGVDPTYAWSATIGWFASFAAPLLIDWVKGA